jgi:aminoglycoside 3-N-acetyltransferase
MSVDRESIQRSVAEKAASLSKDRSAELNPETNLVQSGYLSSLALIELISALEGEFDVEFDLESLDPVEFSSIAGLVKLVESSTTTQHGKSYDCDDARRAIELTGISSGDILFVHSSLYQFGTHKGCEISDLPEMFYGLLREFLGEEGTIVVPTFTLSFCNGTPFDRQNTPSEKMGEFAEYVRLQPGALRSSHPMQSVTAVGPRAAEICQADTPSAFDKGGAFDFLIANGSIVMLLGSTVRYTSCVHYAEQHHGVPYRYWKEFSGTYVDEGVSAEKMYKMYVRQLDPRPLFNLFQVEDVLRDKGKLKESKLGSGWVKSFLMADFVAETELLLKADPYALCVFEQ